MFHSGLHTSTSHVEVWVEVWQHAGTTMTMPMWCTKATACQHGEGCIKGVGGRTLTASPCCCVHVSFVVMHHDSCGSTSHTSRSSSEGHPRIVAGDPVLRHASVETQTISN